MISLRVLGAVELLGGDGEALRNIMAQPKRLALLVFLTADPARPFHSRDELLGLFWPELNTERARAALSQALYFLRKELGEEAVQTRGKDEVGLDPAVVDCDVRAFREAHDDGDHGRALDLYRGDLLEGLYLVDTVEWEDWLGSERERLRSLAAASARALAERAGESGDMRELARLGARALQLSRDDEHTLQQLVAALDRLGDRAGAVRQYQAWAERLRRDLDIEPSPESRALYERVLSRDGIDGAPAPMQAVPPEPSAASSDRRSPRPWRSLLLAGMTVMAIATWWVWRDHGETPTAVAGDANELVSLLIPPFSDDTATAGLDDVAFGLRDELAHRLSGLHQLVLSLPEGEENLLDQAEVATGARRVFVLHGEIGRSDDGLRVAYRLSRRDVPDAAPRVLEVAFDDLPETSATAAEWVAAHLLHGVTADDRERIRHGLSIDPEAFTLYQRGRYQMMAGTGQAFQAARELFEQSLARDPSFARAWSGLADAFVGLAWAHVMPDEVAAPRARSAAERSLALDPALAEGHASLALVMDSYLWQFEAAERHFREAVRLQPSNADAHLRFAAYLRNTGRFDEAREQVGIALELDPFTFQAQREQITLDLLQREFNPALARARQAVELRPGSPVAHFLLARCLIAVGDFDAARHALTEAGPPVMPPALTLLAYLDARDGHPEKARQAMRSMQAAAERNPGMRVHFDLAVVHLALGETDLAMAGFEQAADARDTRVRLLRYEPMFDDLSGQPRFEALLVRLGLPGTTTRPDQAPAS